MSPLCLLLYNTLTDLDGVHAFDGLSELHGGCEENALRW